MKIKRITLLGIILVICVIFILIYVINNNYSNFKEISEKADSNKQSCLTNLDEIYAIAYKDERKLVALYNDGSEELICNLNSEKYKITDFDNNVVYLSGSKNYGTTDVYAIDLTQNSYKPIKVTSIPVAMQEDDKKILNGMIRNVYQSYVVNNGYIYYYDNSKFIKYNIDTGIKKSLIKNPIQDINFINKELNLAYNLKSHIGYMGKEFDCRTVDLEQETGFEDSYFTSYEDFENYEEFQYMHLFENYAIPIDKVIFCPYIINGYSAKKNEFGIVKIDLENKQMEKILTSESRIDELYFYNNNIIFESGSSIYSLDIENLELIEIYSRNNKEDTVEFSNKIFLKENFSGFLRLETSIKNTLLVISYIDSSHGPEMSEIICGIDLDNNFEIVKKEDVFDEYSQVLYIN